MDTEKPELSRFQRLLKHPATPRLLALVVMLAVLWGVAAAMGWTRDLDIERVRGLVQEAGAWGVVVYLAVFAGAELAHIPEVGLSPIDTLRRAYYTHRLFTFRGRWAELPEVVARMRAAAERTEDGSLMCRVVEATLTQTVRRGDLMESKALITELERLNKRPDFHEDLSYWIGQSKQKLGRAKEALAHYNAALEATPGNALFLRAAGTAYLELEQYDKAKDHLERAQQADRKLEGVFFYLGRTALAQKQHDIAINHFNAALEESKGNMTYLYWRAVTLEAQGNRAGRKAAQTDFGTVTQAMQKNPYLEKTLCDAYYQHGKLFMDDRNKWGVAVQDFERANKCDGKRPEVWTALGQIQEWSNNHKKALASYYKAIQVGPEYGEAYDAAAQIEIRNRQLKKGRALLQKAIKNSPKLAPPYYRLCQLSKDRSPAKAKKLCQKYVELAPKGDYASEANDLLRSL